MSVVEDLLYVQLFLSHVGDGDLERHELDFIEDSLVQVGGTSRADAHALLTSKRATYLDDMAAHPEEAVDSFQQRVDRLGTMFAAQRDVLAHLYQDLVRLTSMDGDQEAGERSILEGIRADWGLDG